MNRIGVLFLISKEIILKTDFNHFSKGGLKWQKKNKVRPRWKR